MEASLLLGHLCIGRAELTFCGNCRVLSSALESQTVAAYKFKLPFYSRLWRNWQTRKPQELVAARSWRFKSSQPHSKSIIIVGGESLRRRAGTGSRFGERIRLLHFLFGS
jgi:hypothetical protein